MTSKSKAVEAYLRANRIAQITFMPETEHFAEGFSVVIGNNRYFAATVEDAVAQASMTLTERMAA